MKYNPNIHRRRSIRLKHYDYSQAGAYFLTIVAQGRLCMFGDVAEGNTLLNDAGRMISDAWHGLPERFPNIELDAFVVMPNHIHGIIVMGARHDTPVGAALVAARNDKAPTRNNRAGTRPAPTVLGDIVGAFKSITTDTYITGVKRSGWPSFPGKLWQRNFYEHIIRNDEDLQTIREYISNNPARWEEDTENPTSALKASLTKSRTIA
jgi:putative transposase